MGRAKFVIDLDGVIYRDNKPLPHAKDLIELLSERGIDFILATNNSTKTREMFANKLKGMGIEVSPAKIITSSYVTAEYLRKERGKALIVGEKGIREEIKRIGWDILDHEEWKEATHVIVGMDRSLTYDKLKYATLAINDGARFIATNKDGSFPSEEGLIPGAGSIVSALETATGRRAKVMGKPYQPYVKIVKKILGKGDHWVVGDRIDTDMVLADKMNAKKVLILTGVSRVPRGDEDFVFKDLGGLIELLEKMGL